MSHVIKMYLGKLEAIRNKRQNTGKKKYNVYGTKRTGKESRGIRHNRNKNGIAQCNEH